MKKVMFICSGGGHLAEMKKLEPLFSDYQSILVVEKQTKKPGIASTEVFLPKGTRKHRIRYLFVFLWICVMSLLYYVRFRPDTIVTTGAHTAVPMCYLASLFRKKIIFIESIARVHSKSLAGKLIETRCTHILVQWEEMQEIYPTAKYVGPLL